MGKLVNKRDLAEIVGVSERTFTEWQKEPGFPIEVNGGRGAENVYDTAKVIKFMVERDVAKRAGESPRDRLDRVKADMVEVDLAERLSQLAPAALFERAWTDHIVAAKNELMSLPHRLVSEIHALHGVMVDPDLMQIRIEEALKKLEKFDVDLDEPEADGLDEDDGPQDD
ncbi:MAG: terminase small subunit [Variovorax sp.]|nr:terminase small subunit [Variovorax sp.]